MSTIPKRLRKLKLTQALHEKLAEPATITGLLTGGAKAGWEGAKAISAKLNPRELARQTNRMPENAARLMATMPRVGKTRGLSKAPYGGVKTPSRVVPGERGKMLANQQARQRYVRPLLFHEAPFKTKSLPYRTASTDRELFERLMKPKGRRGSASNIADLTRVGSPELFKRMMNKVTAATGSQKRLKEHADKFRSTPYNPIGGVPSEAAILRSKHDSMLRNDVFRGKAGPVSKAQSQSSKDLQREMVKNIRKDAIGRLAQGGLGLGIATAGGVTGAKLLQSQMDKASKRQSKAKKNPTQVLVDRANALMPSKDGGK